MASDATRKDHRISIKVLEAKLKDDEIDSYIAIKVVNESTTEPSKKTNVDVGQAGSSSTIGRSARRSSQLKDFEITFTGKTKIVTKSKNPWFDDEFEIDLNDKFKDIVIEFMGRSLLKDRCIGTLVLNRYMLENDSKAHESWYYLQNAFGDNETMSIDGRRPSVVSNVSVRVKYTYTEEYILPLPQYSKLLEIVLKEDFKVAQILGRVTEEREEVAKILITITHFSSLSVPFLCATSSKEIKNTTDPNTIFRHNSLGSKGIDQYMKLVGMKYLKQVLQPVITEILTQNRPCELDPTRLEKNDNVEENFTVLEAYIKWVLDRIFGSAATCPVQLRHIFSHLRREVIERFSSDPVVPYTVVTAFIFLRFFNAAILGPQLFGLSQDTEPPSPRNARTLTLISKTVQQLANMTPFDGKKEPYMAILNNIVQNNVGKMKRFVDEITVPPSDTEINGVVKKKEAGFKLSRLFSFSNKDKAEEKKEINVEKYMAALHRQLMRAIDKMATAAESDEKEDVDKLKEVLNEMMESYLKNNYELKQEREAALSKIKLTKTFTGERERPKSNIMTPKTLLAEAKASPPPSPRSEKSKKFAI